MIDLKAVVKKERAKLPMTGDPGNGKTPEEIKKEILENRKAMEASAVKKSAAEAAKKQKEKAAIEAQAAKEKEENELLPVYTTKPIVATHMDCPFCGSEKSIKGMNRHIAAIHEVPGVTVQDLDDVENDLKSLPDLVSEKFEGPATIANLSPEVDKKYFSDWNDIKEDLEDPDNVENPEDQEGLEDQEGPEDLEDSEKALEDPRENRKSLAGPIGLALGIAAIFLSRTEKGKEIFDKLYAALGDLGSKKFSDPSKPSGTNFSNRFGGNRRF